jgi:hypothetical protein
MCVCAYVCMHVFSDTTHGHTQPPPCTPCIYYFTTTLLLLYYYLSDRINGHTQPPRHLRHVWTTLLLLLNYHLTTTLLLLYYYLSDRTHGHTEPPRNDLVHARRARQSSRLPQVSFWYKAGLFGHMVGLFRQLFECVRARQSSRLLQASFAASNRSHLHCTRSFSANIWRTPAARRHCTPPLLVYIRLLLLFAGLFSRRDRSQD